MRVGLTGGIGSGKSSAAEIFAELGALVVDADVLAREAVAPGTKGLAQIERRWPQVVHDGILDRAALARIVFDDSQALAELEAIVHPFVRARAAEIEGTAAPDQLVVHVVPLLFESGYWSTCDKTLYVDAPVETRIARVIARDGWTREEIERRIAVQIDRDEALELADYVIENDGDLAKLRGEVERVDALLRQSE